MTIHVFCNALAEALFYHRLFVPSTGMPGGLQMFRPDGAQERGL